MGKVREETINFLKMLARRADTYIYDNPEAGDKQLMWDGGWERLPRGAFLDLVKRQYISRVGRSTNWKVNEAGRKYLERRNEI